MKILMYSIFAFDKSFIENTTHGKLEIEYTDKSLNEDTAILAKGYEGIALFTADDASDVVLEKLYLLGIRYIALRSVGYDHINIMKARALGIKVANVPAYSPYSVAEHAVALLMALNRKITLGQKLMQMGDYRLDNLIGFDLHGKKVGIIGTGKIGAAFAKIMHGFGCQILAYDPQINEELSKQINISYSTLEELCKNSDVISVHCPLNSETKYMFHKSYFNMMKKGVIFINTARGSVVNTEDLIMALKSGKIGAAGLDVYEKEKNIFFGNHMDKKFEDNLYTILRAFPNVLITGHQGFLTNEALQGIANTTIANFNAWSYAGICENEIN
ncbi:2-hydroxyacid dehydrogenase [Flavobacterium hiemivividum]|uniref:2-hydroxyacid dehydrogenase n=1 Tax=Flavobacterium hiemivividum TaxID=2541734 RepID=A0A4R5CUJ4_9FLAO|nr:2-hydroxyacid dehydrogenase [Flavobacterium hiemivividum]TDE01423.1 2-hydroxyacid dehydrogenase [Flavobacterium hiemivividum]